MDVGAGVGGSLVAVHGLALGAQLAHPGLADGFHKQLAGVAPDLGDELDDRVRSGGIGLPCRGRPGSARLSCEPPDNALKHGGGLGLRAGETASNDVEDRQDGHQNGRTGSPVELKKPLSGAKRGRPIGQTGGPIDGKPEIGCTSDAWISPRLVASTAKSAFTARARIGKQVHRFALAPSLEVSVFVRQRQ